MIGNSVKIYVQKSDNYKDGYIELTGIVIKKKKKSKRVLYYVDCGAYGKYWRLFKNISKK